MINHPVTFHRDFRNDFPPIPKDTDPDGIDWQKCKKAALAVIPLIGMHRAFRGPLSLGMSGVRCMSHASQVGLFCAEGDFTEASFHFLHASLALTAVSLFFFNPVLCYLSTSVSDAIINSRTLFEQMNAGKAKESAESLAFLTLDLLFLVSFCYGSIEITVLCMMLQILLDLYLSAGHFEKGDYFEGICQSILAASHMHAAIPQVKVLNWKWRYNPILKAELKQNEKGLVYLDIPDEYVYSLHKLLGKKAELPPYFGKGKVGGHVTVILSDEMRMRNGIKIEDLGKTFEFRIVNMDVVKPETFKGVDEVYFLTLSAPELHGVRTRHGFAPRIKDHDFHLTFGVTRSVP